MIRYAGFHDLLGRMNDMRPSAAALTYWDDGVRAMTWGELSQRVSARAQQLKTGGRACEAIVTDGSPECVVEIFAAREAGLQVALLDPFMPIKAATPLLNAVDADCVWASDALRQMELQRCLSPARPPAGALGAILFFTSGTTSAAKAVELSDASLMASAYNGSSLLPLAEDDTLLCLLPLSHVFGFVCGLLWGLSCNATVALGRGPRHYGDDFCAFNPTAVALVPKLLEYVLNRNALNDRLSLVLVGAADCPDELLEAARARGIRTSLGYGLTEASSGVALSTGADFHAMTLCPDDSIRTDQEGEIILHAPTCMMRGYYRDEKRTADVLCNGELHTGDVGFLDESGLLHVKGRKKDVIVLANGTKVFVPEYEAAIVDALGQRDVALIDIRDTLVLACGTLEPAMAKDEIMQAIAPVMDTRPRGSQVASVVHMGHPLPRTKTGDVERYKIREELEGWQPSKR